MNKEFRVWDAYQCKMSYGDKNKDLTIAFTNGKLSEVSLDDNENSCGWSAVPIDLERANRYFAQQYTGLTDSIGKKNLRRRHYRLQPKKMGGSLE